MSTPENPRLAISLRILSGVLFAGMLICVKAVSLDVPLGEIVFFRSGFALIPLMMFLWIRREFTSGLATKRPLGHFVRASCGALAMFASFAAIARLGVAEAVLVAQLSPILMAIAAIVMLSERLTRWRVGGLTLGFTGVVVLVWPELGARGGQHPFDRVRNRVSWRCPHGSGFDYGAEPEPLRKPGCNRFLLCSRVHGWWAAHDPLGLGYA